MNADGKTCSDPLVGEVTLRKSARARRMSLRVSPSGKVSVVLPRWMPYRLGVLFFQSKRDWILAVRQRQKERSAALPPREAVDVEKVRREAKAVLPQRLSELAARHGFTYNKVFIKNNRSNWGSCSVRGNINLNLRLALLPPELCDYVLLHELCHLRYPNHGPRFHELLESVCPGHRALQRRLRSYPLGD